MILTLKIELIFGTYAEDNWSGIIEIDSASTLDKLHFAIQKAVKFDNDHMYEFYISRTERSRDRTVFDYENGDIYNLTLEKLYPLPERRSFYYMFDYGDCWLFKIVKMRKIPQNPVPRVKYPRLISETGKKPEQYPSDEIEDD